MQQIPPNWVKLYECFSLSGESVCVRVCVIWHNNNLETQEVEP